MNNLKIVSDNLEFEVSEVESGINLLIKKEDASFLQIQFTNKTYSRKFEHSDQIEKSYQVMIEPNKNDVLGDYPHTARKEEKVLYYLNKIGKAVRIIEIEEFIRQQEGPVNSERTLKSLYHQLTKVMAPKGMVALLKFLGSSRHLFFALPEFLDDNKHLKEECYPMENTWGKLPISERIKMKNSKWIYMKTKINNQILK